MPKFTVVRKPQTALIGGISWNERRYIVLRRQKCIVLRSTPFVEPTGRETAPDIRDALLTLWLLDVRKSGKLAI